MIELSFEIAETCGSDRDWSPSKGSPAVNAIRLLLASCAVLAMSALPLHATGKDPYPAPVPPFHHLVEEGTPSCTIVLAENPSDIESHAARELVEYLERISGVRMGISKIAANRLYPIHLGASAREFLTDAETDRLGSEGFLLRSNTDGIFICGAEDLGTLYGTYQFIEKHLGVRWFMPGKIGEVVPSSPVVRVGMFDEVSTPSFRYRWIDSGQWALRNKMNVRVSIGDKEVGVRWKWGFHTFFSLIPADEFDRHPEWFALIDGQRRRPKRRQQSLQLCTSNPSLVEEVAKEINKIFDDDPSLDILSLAPQDGGGFCQCENCRELDEERPPETRWHAQYSRRLAFFNNAVARKVAVKHPDKLVKVGAYAMYLRVPLDDDYRPEPNLAVQACHTYSCNNHRVALPTCERNREYFTEELKRWAQLTDHLFVYEYYNKGAWGGLPYHQVHVIKEDLPFFHRIGVEGFYTQRAGKRWSAVGLNHYIAAKLAWDVDLDVDLLMEDFYLQFYGESAGPMRSYWQTLERAFVESGQCISPFGLKWTTLVAPDIFTPRILADLADAVARAEKLARSEAVRDRVHFARTMVDFTQRAMDYLNTIRAPFTEIDLNDSGAVEKAHQAAIALGEPLSKNLRDFCKANQIPIYDRLIEAHREVRYIVERPQDRVLLR
jgi:uncharacterized protein DUF4838/glycosyl hydrolase family 67